MVRLEAPSSRNPGTHSNEKYAQNWQVLEGVRASLSRCPPWGAERSARSTAWPRGCAPPKTVDVTMPRYNQNCRSPQRWRAAAVRRAAWPRLTPRFRLVCQQRSTQEQQDDSGCRHAGGRGVKHGGSPRWQEREGDETGSTVAQSVTTRKTPGLHAEKMPGEDPNRITWPVEAFPCFPAYASALL